MVIGAESCEWRRVTWLAARVESMFSKSAVDPDKINPYLRELRAIGQIEEDDLPTRRPFSLGSFESLEQLVDPSRRFTG